MELQKPTLHRIHHLDNHVLSFPILVLEFITGSSAVDSGTHYLTFSLDDPKVFHFDIVLRYQRGPNEALEFNRPDQTAERNEGHYFTTLIDAPTALQEVDLTFPETATGDVAVQVCRTPDGVAALSSRRL